MALLRYSDVKDFENIYLLIDDDKEKVSETVRLKISSIKEEILSKISSIFKEETLKAKLQDDIKVLQQMTSTIFKNLQQKQHEERKIQDDLKKEKLQAEKFLEKYEKYTGMKIRPVNGIVNTVDDTNAISITFTNIDECNPCRPFEFILMVDGNTYNVRCCTPPVFEMNELITELNKTLDLSSFVIKVRKKFNETVNLNKHQVH